MMQNLAFDAAVMYGLSNIAEKSLQFEECHFEENYGKSNLIHMLLSSLHIDNSTFTNNYAKHVTHGITLISSNLVVNNSLIQFDNHCHYAYNIDLVEFVEICDEDENFLDRLNLDKLDTGFFNLYLTSSAHITGNTVVRNLRG